MAFGTTDRVETTAWRAQARRVADTPRAADPARSRFGEMLSESTPAKPPAASAPERTATDRRDTPPADRRDGPEPDRAQAPREAGSPAKDRPDAADRAKKDKAGAGDGTEQPVAAEATPDGAAKPASPEAGAKGGDDPTAMTGIPTPALVPAPPSPVPPIQPPPTAPTPTAAGQASEGIGAGMQAAGASPAAAPRTGAASTTTAVAAGDSDATAGDGDATGAAGSASKDFLAALSDQGSGQASSQVSAADASGTPPSAQVPASGAASGTTGTVHAAATPTAPTPPAVPIGQVPMTIGLRSLAGSSEFQIRLDPLELGRIDVKLEIDKAKGTVSTHLTVDRPDTLALLQRDAGQLQQALTQAGFDPGTGGVNLSLRGDGGQQAGSQGGQQGADARTNTPWSADRADPLPETVPVQRLRGYGGLDIRI